MDVKKLAGLLIAVGGVTTLAAFVWWASFYGKVMKEIGKKGSELGDAVKCLYSSGGECGFVSSFAQFAGVTPYNPTVFWIGVVILGIGIVLFLSAKKEK